MVTDQNPADALIQAGERGTYTRDLRLVHRAIVNDWDVTPEQKKALPERAFGLAMNSPDDRSAVAAMKVLIAMDNANISRKKVDNGPAGVTVNVGVNVDNRPIATVDERNSRLAAICRIAAERGGTSGSIEVVGTATDSVLPAQSNGEASGVPIADV